MTSIKYLLLQKILQKLKECSFEPDASDDGEVKAIDPAAIVFRKVIVAQRPENESYRQEELPGIIVSTPRQTSQTVAGGENARDWWEHRFLLQIIDGDRSPSDRYASYWKWQEQIVELFNFDNLEDIVPSDVGCVFQCIVAMVDDVDEKLWVRHPRFVSGVDLTVITLKNRPVGENGG